LTVSIPPEAPTLTAPGKDEMLTDTTTPVFTWSATGATYEIQINIVDDFEDDVLFTQTISDPTFTPENALADGDYFWRVRAINTHGTPGDWTVSSKLMVSIPPEAPTQTDPDNGENVTGGMPVFTWSETGASYEIQINTVDDFNDAAPTPIAVSAATYTPDPALADGVHYWRVRAINGHGTPGDWSASWAFTITP
jgi:predicted phage tail protein